ncbi:MAG: NAD(P)H-dependent oxidoreductase [Candidatus Gracilibacteria bacterium]|nr:NAD(P)H-dependent oxidoreductase [Candidatus Gracilibacteria bacterium]
MNLLESLKWRYATKVFDKTKKVSQSDLSEILEAFRLSASSFGLQPWKIVVVENPELRQKLLPVSWNQSQVVDASHLLVLARLENVGEDLVEKYLDDIIKTRGVKKEDLAGYENMMKGALNSKTTEERNFWEIKQIYIALGNLLAFLASKQIDSCPMEGFDSKAYDEILGLKQLGLASCVVLPIGYRSEDDKYSQLPKVRFDLKDLVIKM